MGKSEILMLLAGVALSIMLAMIAIPMFSSGSEMAERQQVQQDLMSIKSSIPLIKSLEGSINAGNIDKHMDGFEPIKDGDGKVTGIKGKKALASYTITDDGTNVSVSVAVTTGANVDLTKFSRLNDICDKGINEVDKFDPNTDEKELTCIIKK